jgi:hypothetical protein
MANQADSTPKCLCVHCIQVGVVGFTDGKLASKLGHPDLFVPHWSPDIYKHLHLLT